MKFNSLYVIAFAFLISVFYFYAVRMPADTIPRDHEYNEPGEYPLYDPEMAPEEIRGKVKRGFQLMFETVEELPEYVGGRISCSNCHFNGGNNLGGRSCGYSLVGVVHKYPRHLPNGDEYTLAERMNSCFLKSLNGKQLPVDSEEMDALVTYLEWISSGIPKLDSYPWMGGQKLESTHVADYNNGEKLFGMKCAPCHGENGEGQHRPYQLDYPPLWGEHAFNDAAGMNMPHIFTYFIYKNMPYNEPKLSVEEAMDIAEFVTKQPRPKFNPPAGYDY